MGFFITLGVIISVITVANNATMICLIEIRIAFKTYVFR